MGISTYLQILLGKYLENRCINYRDTNRQITAGVPQGSVLGPTLWNVFFNGILELQYEEGVIVITFADDLGVVVMAETATKLNKKGKEWMKGHDLQISPQKSEAVVLKGPRERDGFKLLLDRNPVKIKKALKYLGVWIDTQGYFGTHVVQTTKKADVRVAVLSRILPIGGPSLFKRKVLAEIVHSTSLYAAPVWQEALRIGKYKNVLISTQRKILLSVIYAYRTISAIAAQVLAL